MVEKIAAHIGAEKSEIGLDGAVDHSRPGVIIDLARCLLTVDEILQLRISGHDTLQQSVVARLHGVSLEID